MIITVSTYLRPKFKFWPTVLCPRHYSVIPEDEKLISLLKSCNRTSEISQIQSLMIKTGLDLIPFPLSKLLASSILDIEYAASIFKHIQNPNLFMFNTMLRGYSISDDPKQAFVLFNYMRAQNVLLDQFSFVSTLKSCARVSAIWTGLGIHSVVLRSGYDIFLNVKNTLLHFYCVCGKIGDARHVFDELSQERDLVSWNTLMGGYLHASHPSMVIDLFQQLNKAGQRIGVTTVLSALSAFGDLGNVLGGKSVHGYCIKSGFCLYLNVVTALIGMYGNTGNLDSGRRVFNEVTGKDVVLWNCLIDKYAKIGLLEESIALIQLMKVDQVKPNSSTLIGLLLGCAASGSLALGRRVHKYIEGEHIVLDAVLGTGLVDMYSKCGLLEKATDVFDRIQNKDVKLWTAMISGFGFHGQAKNAIKLFHRMEEEGFIPNEITLLVVLSACSHGGLVTEGSSCFERMVRKYGLTPKVEHYGCVIDLLGRAGLLEEAYQLIKSLPIKGDATAWRALLAGCRVHGNVGLGECVKRVLEEIFDEHPADSIILSSTYAIAGRLPDQAGMVETYKENMTKEAEHVPIGVKEAGCSAIELGSQGL
ncbi:pentatricopeptide repeat-containing protein At1g26900, mitochondrial [Cornus florida]|uniref:pentatricopeptide repeat-containing protein At1g26900, mitochondrial n=1 Tax=Cornus florida TaxID=4283 RepID=UPI0028A2C377|nr:pentatricopeptide repeat-containing protein At1g26900, mitochondrial [Cornus florida]